MSRLRSRIVSVGLVGVVVAVLFAAPAAQADTTTPGPYHAKASATALELTVFGQGLSLGLTHAENASDPTAVARGLGALVPVIGNQVDQTATATGNGAAQDMPETCGPITLPADFPVLDLATACSSASASVNDVLPSSVGNASVATIKVNAAELAPVVDAVKAPVGQLIDGLKPVFDALQQSGIDASTVIKDIVSAITSDGDLVRISLGPSTSNSNADSAVETARAAANGAVIDVLPRDLLQLDPVLKIEVGAAANTISIDRATGTATTSYEPSLVKVTIAKDIATALGLTDEQRVVTVTPGVSQCLGLPAPLDSCISVGSGSQGVTPEGVTHAEASGVSLHLLTGVQDGIVLNLAETSVEGIGAVQAVAPPDQPSLARTGGSTPLALMAVVLGVGFVGVSLSRRARRDIALR